MPDRVDHRLLRSAIARVHWESDVLRVRGIPRFWTDQALGPVFDALLRPGVDAARIAEVTRLLRAVPAILAHAPAALRAPAREFAGLAVAELDGIAGRVEACAQALARIESHRRPRRSSARPRPRPAAPWSSSAGGSRAALAGLPPAVPVGRERYEWFLREVACVPLGVDEIAVIGRREYERAVWLELLHATRNRGRAGADAARRRRPPGQGRGRATSRRSATSTSGGACSASRTRCGTTSTCPCPATWSRCASSAWPTT